MVNMDAAIQDHGDIRQVAEAILRQWIGAGKRKSITFQGPPDKPSFYINLDILQECKVVTYRLFSEDWRAQTEHRHYEKIQASAIKDRLYTVDILDADALSRIAEWKSRVLDPDKFLSGNQSDGDTGNNLPWEDATPLRIILSKDGRVTCGGKTAGRLGPSSEKFFFLQCLLAHRGEPVSHQELMECVVEKTGKRESSRGESDRCHRIKHDIKRALKGLDVIIPMSSTKDGVSCNGYVIREISSSEIQNLGTEG